MVVDTPPETSQASGSSQTSGSSNNNTSPQNGSGTTQVATTTTGTTTTTIGSGTTNTQTQTSGGEETRVQLFSATTTSNEDDVDNKQFENALTTTAMRTTALDATTPALAPATFISVAVNFINAALSPILTPDPTAPVDSPLLWAVMGWVRRQFNQAFDQQSSPAAADVTTALALETEDVSAAALPPDFERTVIASGLESPTDMAFLPDGSILIAQQNGTILQYHDGHVDDEPFLVLNTNSEGERGLLGIEVDPNFTADGTGWIYVSYTNAATNHDTLSRVHVTNYVADPSTEDVLVESDKDASSIHHGGELAFDLTGEHLYWSVGDNIFAPNAQDLSTIHGKILRINPDGSIPEDNPFVGVDGARPEIYAYGFRNPFRFTFAPTEGVPEGTLLVGDVGSASWEELNVVKAGANYGWPGVEGTCTGVCDSVNPIYVYPHSSGVPQQGSITSVLFYTGDAFGPEYKNTVFIADYALGFMKNLQFDPKFESFIGETMFDEAAGTTVKLMQGPNGEIYQLTIFPGELSVIAPSGGNRAPSSVITATPSNGLSPLEVDFSSEGSSDPEGEPLTYTWDFGDGSPVSTEANPTHTYTGTGVTKYTVSLTVSDGERSTTTTQEITVGSRAPTAVISLPDENTTYNAGDTIDFSGVGSSDPDGDPLTYEWKVVFHHEQHVHPFEDGIVGQTGSVEIPTTADNLPTTWYRIHLTVTDTNGLSSTTYVDVFPNTVDMTFVAPPGTTITIDGVPHTGTYTEKAVVGVVRTISAPSPQTVDGQQLEFIRWSDGRPQTHTITTPDENTTYTAVFEVVNTEPVERFAILKQLVHNQVANFDRLVSAFRTGGVGDAVSDILSTSVARAKATAGAVVSNGSELLLAIGRAPRALAGPLIETGNKLIDAASNFDPLGLLGAVQTGAVAFQDELTHQVHVIGRQFTDLRRGIVEALSIPLPPAPVVEV